jgi:hypothetical protein
MSTIVRAIPRWARLSGLVLVLAGAGAGVAQTVAHRADSSPAGATLTGAEHYRLLRRARADAERGDTNAAIASFARLTSNAPTDPGLWSEYAALLERAGRPAEARAALTAFLGVIAAPPPTIEYRIARTFAMEGANDSAFAWLERALAHRYENRPRIQEDSAFRSLRADPRFARVAGLRTGELDRNAAWRADLDYLVAEAQRLHVGFERQAFSEPFLGAARALRDRIPTLSDDRVALEMRALLAMLGDGHTNVFPRFSRFPVDFYQFSDGLFVIRGSGDAASLVGTQVLRIGRLSAEEAMRAVGRYVSRDNEMGLLMLGPALLGQPIVLQAIGATDDTSSVELTVRDRQGTTRTVRLASAAPGRAALELIPLANGSGTPPLYLQDRSAYWLRPIAGTPIVYVQYNAVADDERETPEQFAARLLAVTRETKATELVIDVRHNGGGNTYLYPPILDAIIAFQEAAPDHRIWVIIGRRTFSAAQNFATTIQRYTNAIYVGERTGSRPNFVGESPPVILPYSGLYASISSRYHQNTDFTDNRAWIAPDVPTPLSSADYFANRDPAMAAIMELVKKPVT